MNFTINKATFFLRLYQILCKEHINKQIIRKQINLILMFISGLFYRIIQMTITWKKYLKFKKNIPEDKDSVHPETFGISQVEK